MTEKNTGGPAFPVTLTDKSGQIAPTETGMTLRDYFAANTDIPWNAVIESLLINKGISCPTVGDVLQKRAAMKYAEADEMLKEREK